MKPFDELVDHGQDVPSNCQIFVVYHLLVELPNPFFIGAMSRVSIDDGIISTSHMIFHALHLSHEDSQGVNASLLKSGRCSS